LIAGMILATENVSALSSAPEMLHR
jgi:hypothetical protein